MSLFTAALLAACGTVEDETNRAIPEALPEGVAANVPVSRASSHREQNGELPPSLEVSTAKESPNLLDAVGEAIRRPFDTLAQALDPEKLRTVVEKGVSRAMIRQARRQFEEENAYRHPTDQIEFQTLTIGRVDPRDSSLAANYWDIDYTAQSFAPFRPRVDVFGFVPLSDLTQSKNPLRFDLRVPSANHARRFMTGEESAREFLEQFEYRASLELSAHGDLVSVVYAEDFVGVSFVHPIRRR